MTTQAIQESITEVLADYKIDLQKERRELKAALRREIRSIPAARLRQRLDEIESELQNLKTETLY